jgi:hypothetical protein
MKIQSPHHGIHCQQPGGCGAFRLLSVVAAIGLCVIASTAAEAQSRGSGQPMSLQLNSPSTIRDGLLTHGDERFRVIDAGTVRTAADLGDSPLGGIAQVDFATKARCSGADCTNCATCGPCSSYGDLRTNYIDPCGPCDPYWYISIEGLYMEPDTKNRFSLSPNFTMGQYDFEFSPRLTVGSVPDCVHGYELTYVAPLEWARLGAASDAGGNINTVLTTDVPLSAADLTSFNGATFQSQAYTAEYWGIEANSTLSGWDVAKLLIGARYISYEERYSYLSQTASESGLLLSAIDNQLFGVQVGADLLYPISQYGYLDFRSRLIGFINSVDAGLHLVNDSATVLVGSDDKNRTGAALELGGGIRFQPGRSLSIRAGGELWYINGLATSSRQLRHGIVGTTTITATSVKDDILIAGATIGAELKY